MSLSYRMRVVYLGTDGTMETRTVPADVETFDELVGGTAYPLETLRLTKSKSTAILMGDFRNVTGHIGGMKKNPYENIYGNAFWIRDHAGDFAGLMSLAEKEIKEFYQGERNETLRRHYSHKRRGRPAR